MKLNQPRCVKDAYINNLSISVTNTPVPDRSPTMEGDTSLIGSAHLKQKHM